jgi:7-cyano-7-deazaguanine reductase
MAKESPLGKSTVYIETYSPDLLFPISRQMARDKIGINPSNPLPFEGIDIWNGFEISWLNPKGKPEIAFGEYRFPFNTPYVVESKSFKLYLNSFNQSVFSSIGEVEKIIQKDLREAVQGDVGVSLFFPENMNSKQLSNFRGTCLDHLDIEVDTYQVNPQFLSTSPKIVDETLYSHLLKSNCLATGQPDWGGLLIRYQGPQIDHEGLLKYIISFRSHSGFAEHCVEQIYCDLLRECKPKHLTVYARYIRRGGLDINPFRSNFEKDPDNSRHTRQ